MEYQVVNEISSFWENLMLPIIMGIITIIFILWIMGEIIEIIYLIKF
jgi:hypothetical protein